jgi:NADH dehydrogenase FAD-containing subunit
VADAKTIVILGGGVGGVATARALRKRLPAPHRIVLVDREPDHLFAPSLLWLMVGTRTPQAIRRPLARLARKGIDVRIGPVEHIDSERRTVTVAGDCLAASCSSGCATSHSRSRQPSASLRSRASPS